MTLRAADVQLEHDAEVMARWHERVEELPKERQPARVAEILADDWERFALAVQAESELSKRRFVVDWPALARWRDRVLSNRRRYAPDVVAAALEALALECYLSGQLDLADRSIGQARRVVLEHARRTGAHTVPPTPIEEPAPL